MWFQSGFSKPVEIDLTKINDMHISVRIELNSNQRKDRRYDLFIRLTKNKRMKRISTGLHVFKKDVNMDAEYGKWIRKSDPQYMGKNKILSDWYYKAESSPSVLERKGIFPSLEKCAEYLRGIEKETSFVKYYKKTIEVVKSTLEPTTYRRYVHAFDKLTRFLNNKDMSFRDVTVEFLTSYEVHLKLKGNGTNTIQKELKIIRAVLYRAIKEELLPQEQNPFFRYKIKSAKTSKRKLNEKEIILIEKAKPKPMSGAWHARNFWLFSMYCIGIRWGDMSRLRWTQVCEGRINYKMHKTSTEKNLVLLPQALEILRLYEGEKKNDNDLIFPILTEAECKDPFITTQRISSKNALVNKWLKELAVLANISNPSQLSFHLARHSAAEAMRIKGVPVYDISKALGHHSITITEKYLSSFDTKSTDSALILTFSDNTDVK